MENDACMRVPSKVCSSCKQTKPTGAFYPRGEEAKGRFRSRCKSCEAEKRAADAPQRKEYREKNKSKAAAAHALYYQTHKAQIIAYNQDFYQNLRQTRPELEILWRLRARAKKEALPFDLVVEDIQIPSICPVLGIPLVISPRRGRQGPLPDSPSVDRIDPHGGYTRGNIRVISYRANTLKSNATVEEMELVLADLRRLTGIQLDFACKLPDARQDFGVGQGDANQR